MNRSLLTASAAALSVGIGVWWAARRLMQKPGSGAEPRLPLSPGSESRPQIDGMTPTIERDTARKLLLYAVPPAWIAAGLADWLCHRETQIETTAGAKESLMQAELGIPVLVLLFCEVTPLVVISEIVAFVAHEATVYWDLKYTLPRREIPPIEQQVHAYLELLPLVAIALITVMHWPETKSLFGLGTGPIDWSLRLRKNSLSLRYRIGLLTAVTLLNGIPYLEELWRGLRANQEQQHPTSSPGFTH